jgi:hypothetical protein
MAVADAASLKEGSRLSQAKDLNSYAKISSTRTSVLPLEALRDISSKSIRGESISLMLTDTTVGLNYLN